MADGTRIDPTTGEVVRERPLPRFVQVPSNREAVAEVTRVRRKLADLPAPPKTMNLVSVVFCYTTMGLSDTDIAHAAGIGVAQIVTLKNSEVYKAVSAEFIKGISENDLTSVRDLIVMNARTSAQRLLDLASSENDIVALKANESILDRAGLRPADVIEHRHKMEGGLRIEYVRKDTTSDMPVIDLKVEDE